MTSCEDYVMYINIVCESLVAALARQSALVTLTVCADLVVKVVSSGVAWLAILQHEFVDSVNPVLFGTGCDIGAIRSREF